MRFFKKLFSSLFGKNPRKRGRQVATMAFVAFNKQKDAEKFREIKRQLLDFRNSGETLSALMIREFAEKASEELKMNPIVFGLLVSELISVLDPNEPETDEDARQFIDGIIEALNIVFY
jgi:hypothetical protein